MHAIQAIIPEDKLNKETFTSPDKHGGCEFGTWSFIPWSKYFSKIVGHTVYDSERVSAASSVLGVHIMYAFDKEQRDAVVKVLRLAMKSAKRVKREGVWYVTLYEDDDPDTMNNFFMNRSLVVPMKWVKKLISMFGASCDVVWYVS